MAHVYKNCVWKLNSETAKALKQTQNKKEGFYWVVWGQMAEKEGESTAWRWWYSVDSFQRELWELLNSSRWKPLIWKDWNSRQEKGERHTSLFLINSGLRSHMNCSSGSWKDFQKSLWNPCQSYLKNYEGKEIPEDWGWARLALIFEIWVLEIIGLRQVSGNEPEMII